MGPDTADGRRPLSPLGGGGPAAARELIAQWEATATFTVDELAAWAGRAAATLRELTRDA
jgi:hypothetical protein